MSALALAWERQNSRHANYGALLFAIALFGYPIVGNLNSLLGIEDRQLSVMFRLFVGSLSLFFFATLGQIRLDNWSLLILLIWFALVLRLSFDTLIAGIDGADYALQLFILGSVLPVLALWKLDAYDQKIFALTAFIVTSIGSLTSLFANYFEAFGESDLTELTGRLSSVSLNPVSLGHLAVSGFFCGLVLMRQTALRVRIPIAVVMAGLLFVLVQTGSKGPMLSLIIALLMWASQRGMGGRLIALAVPAVALFMIYSSSPLFERLAAINEDPSTLDRVILIRDSIQQIVSSPWLGSASIELNSGYYPHNVVLEAAMSFGLPLTAVLVAVLMRGLVVSWRLLNTKYDLVALLFVQALVISQVSGALFADSMLWVCLILILNCEPTPSIVDEI